MPAMRFQTNHGDDNHLVVQAVRRRAFPKDWLFVMNFISVLSTGMFLRRNRR